MPGPRMFEDAEAFCGRVHPRLVRALAVYLGDREVAAELCQEALVRAWQRWPAVAEMRSPDAWVFRVAFNLANSTLRRRLAERRAHARLRVGDASMQPASDDVLVLRAAVDALPPRQRAAVVLRHLLDMSVEDTADALGCAPGTVKSLTAKGVMHLRDLLGASFVMAEEP